MYHMSSCCVLLCYSINMAKAVTWVLGMQRRSRQSTCRPFCAQSVFDVGGEKNEAQGETTCKMGEVKSHAGAKRSTRKRVRPEWNGGIIKEGLVASLPDGWNDVRGAIQSKALEIGFARARFTDAAASSRIEQYKEWIKDRKHGDMGYLAREDRVARREDLSLILPEVRAVLTLMTLYWPGKKGFPSTQRESNRGTISCYSWGGDYHDIIGARLHELTTWTHQTYGGVGRWYVDTGPLMERDLAERAGLGFIGKNTLLINEQIGSGAFLSEILTTLPIAPEPPRKKTGGCGACKRCIVGCPTHAIDDQGFTMDARRCISYLTIEHKGSIPIELRPLMGNLIYGCDICQQVCPWNRWSWPVPHQPRTIFGLPAEHVTSPLLTTLLTHLRTQADFRARFSGSPIQRIGREKFLRNVAVAMGNSGDRECLVVLRQVLGEENNELVREHMIWAIERLEHRCAEQQSRSEEDASGIACHVAREDVR